MNYSSDEAMVDAISCAQRVSTELLLMASDVGIMASENLVEVYDGMKAGSRPPDSWVRDATKIARVAVEAKRLSAQLDRVCDLISFSQQRMAVDQHKISDPQVREQVWGITNGRCYYCDVCLVREDAELEIDRRFHVDHLVAKSKGGPNHLANYVPACQRCNVSKGCKPFVEFVKERSAATSSLTEME